LIGRYGESVFDVVVLGSANLDLVITAPRIPRPGETLIGSDYNEYAGGKGLNQAIAAARSGAAVAFGGSVGADAAGERLRSEALTAGVDVNLLDTDPSAPTGRAIITVDEEAENSIVVIPGANSTLGDVDIPDARVLLVQLEVPLPSVIAVVQKAKDRGMTTILNPAPAVSLPDELIRVCDLIIPNEHEVELIGGVDALLERGARDLVLTLGAEGVCVTRSSRSPEGEDSWSQPAFDVHPIDTTGAGDAFCGSLAARIASGEDLRGAVRWAAAAGALATTTPGAVPSLPYALDTEQLLAKSPN
jgi:ribokinase